MKENREFMCDGTGLCPKCGAGLIPVPYYRAQVDDSTTERHVDYANRQKVKTTTTSYSNITPCYAGWCLES